MVFHIIPATLKAYELRFSQQELADNWAWILERKAAWEHMELTDNPEPFQHNEPWECDNCRYALSCGLYASIEALKESTTDA